MVGSAVDSATGLLQSVADRGELSVILDADLDLSVKMGLSPDSFQITSSLNELRSSITVTIEDDYDYPISDSVTFLVSPSIVLYLEAYNTAIVDARDAGTTVDIFQTPWALTQMGFGGTFNAQVTFGIALADSVVPASLSMRYYSDDLVNQDGLEFEYLWDIDLDPVKEGYNFLGSVVLFSPYPCTSECSL